jgi:biopolymer transport protein TolR
MSGTGPRRGKPMADINVTPLVDILLVLLVAFIVVADVLGTPKEGLPLDLPKSGAGSALGKSPVRVSITETGVIGVDGSPVKPEELVAQVKAALAKNPNAGDVVVAADGNVRQSSFVAILDALTQAGVAGVTIETVPTAKAP